MSVRMVRAKIKADKAAELEKAAKEMFTAIKAAQPQGVRYASCKLPDGVTYVTLLGLDDDENNPLLRAGLQGLPREPQDLDRRAVGRRGVDARRVVPALLTAPSRHLRRSPALMPVPLTAHGTGMRASHRPRMNPPGSLRRGVARVVGACRIDANKPMPTGLTPSPATRFREISRPPART